MPRAKNSKQPTELELACIANYKGNQVEAARAAGVKNPKKHASAIFKRPRVKAAIEKKISALINASGRDLGKAITITRNDIINGLAAISQDADSDSAKVSAFRALIDIFGLKASDQKGDPFAGWSDEELKHYRETQEFPAWVTAKITTDK